MALFRMEGEPGSDVGNIERLSAILRSNKRETDTLGYLGNDLIALLLPDTDSEGTRGFLEKIVHRSEDLPFSTITGIYPDQLFDSLLSEEDRHAPDLYPLFLDDSKERPHCGYLLKRSLDILGSIFGILVLSPVMLLTAIAIALTSRGPIIYKQVRLGRSGSPFVFYKFRSMYCHVDDRMHREYVTNLIKGDHEKVNQGDVARPVYKMKSDPRITPVGRFIRKTSIDELPQFFNVLKGDMSLVGPRPPLPYEAENYQSWHLRRILEAKPGLTGLWQVQGRSTTSFDDMVRLDLQYMKKCSLMLDLKLLIKTIKVVVTGYGGA
jgi:lipopolysaccharide/colanic/teichoic acid biosynthesis glycosyltransferase